MNREHISFWAPVLSGGFVAACLVYCMYWWEPTPMTWKDPDCSIVCWFYCATLHILWAVLGLFVSGLSILAGLLSRRMGTLSRGLNVIAGFALFPAGLLNFVALWASGSRR